MIGSPFRTTRVDQYGTVQNLNGAEHNGRSRSIHQKGGDELSADLRRQTGSVRGPDQPLNAYPLLGYSGPRCCPRREYCSRDATAFRVDNGWWKKGRVQDLKLGRKIEMPARSKAEPAAILRLD